MAADVGTSLGIRFYGIFDQLKAEIASLPGILNAQLKTVGKDIATGLGQAITSQGQTVVSSVSQTVIQSAVAMKGVVKGIADTVTANRVRITKDTAEGITQMATQWRGAMTGVAQGIANTVTANNRAIAEGVAQAVKASVTAVTETGSVHKRMATGFVEDVKMIITWQARWYASQMLIFGTFRLITQAFREYAEFSETMAQLNAITLATADSSQKMERAIMDTAAATGIGKKELAETAILLARVGLNADEIAQILPLVGKMVKITGEDMRYVVDVLATVMAAWNKDVSEMPHVAEVLSAALNKSKLSIQDLSTALNHLAPIAVTIGLDVSDFAGTLAVLRDQGYKASTAARALRQMIITLLDPSDKAIETFGKLGLTMEEIQPGAVDLYTIFDRLKDAHMSNADAAKIFTANVVPLAMLIKRIGGTIFKDYAAMLETTSSLTEMWDKRQQGLLTRLGQLVQKISNVTIALISLFGPAIDLAIDSLNLLFTILDYVIRGISDFIKSIYAWIKVQSGWVGSIVKVVVEFGTLLLMFRGIVAFIKLIVIPVFIAFGINMLSITAAVTKFWAGLKAMLTLSGIFGAAGAGGVPVIIALGALVVGVTAAYWAYNKWTGGLMKHKQSLADASKELVDLELIQANEITTVLKLIKTYKNTELPSDIRNKAYRTLLALYPGYLDALKKEIKELEKTPDLLKKYNKGLEDTITNKRNLRLLELSKTISAETQVIVSLTGDLYEYLNRLKEINKVKVQWIDTGAGVISKEQALKNVTELMIPVYKSFVQIIEETIINLQIAGRDTSGLTKKLELAAKEVKEYIPVLGKASVGTNELGDETQDLNKDLDATEKRLIKVSQAYEKLYTQQLKDLTDIVKDERYSLDVRIKAREEALVKIKELYAEELEQLKLNEIIAVKAAEKNKEDLNAIQIEFSVERKGLAKKTQEEILELEEIFLGKLVDANYAAEIKKQDQERGLRRRWQAELDGDRGTALLDIEKWYEDQLEEAHDYYMLHGDEYELFQLRLKYLQEEYDKKRFEAFAKGLGQEEREWERQHEAKRKIFDSFFGGVILGIEKIGHDSIEWGKIGYDAVVGFAKKAEGAISDLFFGVLKGKIGSFVEFWKSMWDSLLRVVADSLAAMVKWAAWQLFLKFLRWILDIQTDTTKEMGRTGEAFKKWTTDALIKLPILITGFGILGALINAMANDFERMAMAQGASGLMERLGIGGGGKGGGGGGSGIWGTLAKGFAQGIIQNVATWGKGSVVWGALEKLGAALTNPWVAGAVAVVAAVSAAFSFGLFGKKKSPSRRSRAAGMWDAATGAENPYEGLQIAEDVMGWELSDKYIAQAHRLAGTLETYNKLDAVLTKIIEDGKLTIEEMDEFTFWVRTLRIEFDHGGSAAGKLAGYAERSVTSLEKLAQKLREAMVNTDEWKELIAAYNDQIAQVEENIKGIETERAEKSRNLALLLKELSGVTEGVTEKVASWTEQIELLWIEYDKANVEDKLRILDEIVSIGAEAIRAIQDEISNLKDQLAEAEKVWAAFSGGVDDNIKKIRDYFKTQQELTADLGVELGDLWDKMLAEGDFFKRAAIAEEISDKLTQHFEAMAADIEAALAETEDQLKNAAEAWQEFNKGIDEGIKAIKDYFKTTKELELDRANKIRELWEKILSPKQIQELSEITEDLYNDQLSIATELADKTVEQFESIASSFESLLDQLDQIKESTVSAFASVIEGITDYIQQIGRYGATAEELTKYRQKDIETLRNEIAAIEEQTKGFFDKYTGGTAEEGSKEWYQEAYAEYERLRLEQAKKQGELAELLTQHFEAMAADIEAAVGSAQDKIASLREEAAAMAEGFTEAIKKIADSRKTEATVQTELAADIAVLWGKLASETDMEKRIALAGELKDKTLEYYNAMAEGLEKAITDIQTQIENLAAASEALAEGFDDAIRTVTDYRKTEAELLGDLKAKTEALRAEFLAEETTAARRQEIASILLENISKIFEATANELIKQIEDLGTTLEDLTKEDQAITKEIAAAQEKRDKDLVAIDKEIAAAQKKVDETSDEEDKKNAEENLATLKEERTQIEVAAEQQLTTLEKTQAQNHADQQKIKDEIANLNDQYKKYAQETITELNNLKAITRKASDTLIDTLEEQLTALQEQAATLAAETIAKLEELKTTTQEASNTLIAVLEEQLTALKEQADALATEYIQALTDLKDAVADASESATADIDYEISELTKTFKPAIEEATKRLEEIRAYIKALEAKYEVGLKDKLTDLHTQAKTLADAYIAKQEETRAKVAEVGATLKIDLLGKIGSLELKATGIITKIGELGPKYDEVYDLKLKEQQAILAALAEKVTTLANIFGAEQADVIALRQRLRDQIIAIDGLIALGPPTITVIVNVPGAPPITPPHIPPGPSLPPVFAPEPPGPSLPPVFAPEPPAGSPTSITVTYAPKEPMPEPVWEIPEITTIPITKEEYYKITYPTPIYKAQRGGITTGRKPVLTWLSEKLGLEELVLPLTPESMIKSGFIESIQKALSLEGLTIPSPWGRIPAMAAAASGDGRGFPSMGQQITINPIMPINLEMGNNTIIGAGAADEFVRQYIEPALFRMFTRQQGQLIKMILKATKGVGI